MAFPVVPVVAGAGVALLATLFLMKSSKASSLDPAERNKQIIAAYDAGVKDGKADGTADSGKAHNPRPLLNFSADPVLQQKYDNGYNDGYEKNWVAPAADVPSIVVDSKPTSGGKTGSQTPTEYGCERGQSSGYADARDGYERSSEQNLATTGSKKRQAESGNPAAYRAAYTDCYNKAYTGYIVGKTAGESIPEMAPGIGTKDLDSGSWTDIFTSGTRPRAVRVGAMLSTSPSGSWGPRQTVLAAAAPASAYTFVGKGYYKETQGVMIPGKVDSTGPETVSADIVIPAKPNKVNMSDITRRVNAASDGDAAGYADGSANARAGITSSRPLPNPPGDYVGAEAASWLGGYQRGYDRGLNETAGPGRIMRRSPVSNRQAQNSQITNSNSSPITNRSAITNLNAVTNFKPGDDGISNITNTRPRYRPFYGMI